MDSLNLCINWYQRPAKFGEYCACVTEFVGSLVTRFPELSALAVPETSVKSTRIDTVTGAVIADAIRKQLPWDAVYVNEDVRAHSLQQDSRADLGFSSVFLAAPDYESEPCVIEMSCGAIDSGSANTVVMRFPSTLQRGKFVLEVFRFAIGFWKAESGVVTKPSFDEYLDQPFSEARIGWLTFLPKTKATLPQVPTEETMGGVLIALSKEVPADGDLTFLRLLESVHVALKQGSNIAA